MDEKKLESLPRISWAQFKKYLADKTPFEAISPMGAAYFRVTAYEPRVAIASHAGTNVREELLSIMAIDEKERCYEEDTGTDEMIRNCPIQMIGLDSRYEYDLNRKPDQCIYLKPFQSWGKRVWSTPPSKEDLEVSLSKHDEFHEMLDYLVGEVCRHFGKAFVMDVHAYNCKRQSQTGKFDALPVFNLATSPTDQKKYRKVLDSIAKELQSVDIPGLKATVKENDVFKKDGAIANLIENKHPTSFILPVDIKKIYMDEMSGDVDDKILSNLATALDNISAKISREFFS
jgi:hypothetical protein